MRRRSRHSWIIAALALTAMASSSVGSAWAATCEGACGMPAMPCCEPSPSDAEPPATPAIRALGCCDQRRPPPDARAARSADLAPSQAVGQRVIAAPVLIDTDAAPPAWRSLPAPGFTPVRAAPPAPPRLAVLLL